MRVGGRQKGSKVTPYTHIVVQPSAPKSRYTFSYHSSETKAKSAAKKYEPLVGNPLKVVKQSGKSANTDMMEANKRIPRKPGQPAGSDKHSDLYTDENPKGTIHGLKFATVDDAKASVAKIKKSGKTHAHKIQAAIAMEQRARVMGKTGPAAVYRKFINAMKEKTKEMQKEDNKGFQPAMMLHGPTRKKILAKQKKNREKATESLWANIAAKRARIKRGSGERMRKKGEKGAPTPQAMANAKAASEMMTTAMAGIPQDTKDMGPRFTTTNVVDRRKKKRPTLLKRFARFIEPND